MASGEKVVSKCIMLIIAIKRNCSALTPHVLEEAVDQLTSFCESLGVFGSGAKVSLMSAFNISEGQRRNHTYSVF